MWSFFIDTKRLSCLPSFYKKVEEDTWSGVPFFTYVLWNKSLGTPGNSTEKVLLEYEGKNVAVVIHRTCSSVSIMKSYTKRCHYLVCVLESSNCIVFK